MKSDIHQGRRTVAELKDMREKQLCADYGVSRDTARKARTAVLSEFEEN
jgi:DNA-binding GntR family transcriptional regulator